MEDDGAEYGSRAALGRGVVLGDAHQYTAILRHRTQQTRERNLHSMPQMPASSTETPPARSEKSVRGSVKHRANAASLPTVWTCLFLGVSFAVYYAPRIWQVISLTGLVPGTILNRTCGGSLAYLLMIVHALMYFGTEYARPRHLHFACHMMSLVLAVVIHPHAVVDGVLECTILGLEWYGSVRLADRASTRTRSMESTRIQCSSRMSMAPDRPHDAPQNTSFRWLLHGGLATALYVRTGRHTARVCFGSWAAELRGRACRTGRRSTGSDRIMLRRIGLCLADWPRFFCLAGPRSLLCSEVRIDPRVSRVVVSPTRAARQSDARRAEMPRTRLPPSQKLDLSRATSSPLNKMKERPWARPSLTRTSESFSDHDRGPRRDRTGAIAVVLTVCLSSPRRRAANKNTGEKGKTASGGAPGTLSATVRNAAIAGKPDAVLEFLEKGSADARDDGGCTLLHHCAAHGHAELARAALAHGGDVNAVDASLRTGLHLAARGGHGALVKLLLDAGADAAMVDGQGEARRLRGREEPGLRTPHQAAAQGRGRGARRRRRRRPGSRCGTNEPPTACHPFEPGAPHPRGLRAGAVSGRPSPEPQKTRSPP